MTDRRRIASGGPWEATAGYSRALAIGDTCWVAGTTDAGPDGRSRHPGDVAAQARAILEIIERALAEAGFGLADIVRTRMFVTDIGRSAEVIAVHGEVFGDDPSRGHDGRGQRPDGSEPADRDRGGGATGLTLRQPRPAGPAVRRAAPPARPPGR